MNLFLMMYKPVIVNHAKANADPATLATQIVERIPDAYILIVDDFLKMPTTKETIVYQYAPELREFDAWVDAVMLEMQKVIKESFEPETEEAPEKKDDGVPEAEVAP